MGKNSIKAGLFINYVSQNGGMGKWGKPSCQNLAYVMLFHTNPKYNLTKRKEEKKKTNMKIQREQYNLPRTLHCGGGGRVWIHHFFRTHFNTPLSPSRLGQVHLLFVFYRPGVARATKIYYFPKKENSMFTTTPKLFLLGIRYHLFIVDCIPTNNLGCPNTCRFKNSSSRQISRSSSSLKKISS